MRTTHTSVKDINVRIRGETFQPMRVNLSWHQTLPSLKGIPAFTGVLCLTCKVCTPIISSVGKATPTFVPKGIAKDCILISQDIQNQIRRFYESLVLVFGSPRESTLKI